MITTDKTLYVAGPMTNYPAFNFPAFDAAAEDLRRRGYTIVSPAELDDPAARKIAMASPDGIPTDSDETWGSLLARDVKLVADEVDGICVLSGWQHSKGARLETFVAFLCGKPVVHYPTLNRVRKKALMKAWLGAYFE